jgi:hypothetical protein
MTMMPPDIGLDAATVLGLIDPVTEVRYRRQLVAEAAAEAYDLGFRDGDEGRARRRQATWPPIAAGAAGPSHAELERRRWGPGGREHFGDLRPGDYPGKGTAG